MLFIVRFNYFYIILHQSVNNYQLTVISYQSSVNYLFIYHLLLLSTDN